MTAQRRLRLMKQILHPALEALPLVWHLQS
ncbi:hypothetical protein L345_08565 [Ophiophagus hannah]|uniref:Uncharacterized protein n=1 Tax=Ophiophagus hannah TaxID=8665 RepID=V8NTQ7_OPHHA|nr:hypothetical protein L345_08565 [Ophiophagus hannah]